jgi:hypothetical protein
MNDTDKKDTIDWPELKDEDGNAFEQPSRWVGEWYMDNDEPTDQKHLKMTYKSDSGYNQIHIFSYKEVAKHLEYKNVKEWLEELTNEKQDSEIAEINSFLQHWIDMCDDVVVTHEIEDEYVIDGNPEDHNLGGDSFNEQS